MDAVAPDDATASLSLASQEKLNAGSEVDPIASAASRSLLCFCEIWVGMMNENEGRAEPRSALAVSLGSTFGFTVEVDVVGCAENSGVGRAECESFGAGGGVNADTGIGAGPFKVKDAGGAGAGIEGFAVGAGLGTVVWAVERNEDAFDGGTDTATGAETFTSAGFSSVSAANPNRNFEGSFGADDFNPNAGFAPKRA